MCVRMCARKFTHVHVSLEDQTQTPYFATIFALCSYSRTACTALCVSDRIHYIEVYGSVISLSLLCICKCVCVCLQSCVIIRASPECVYIRKVFFEVFCHQTCEASCAQLDSLFEPPSSHGSLSWHLSSPSSLHPTIPSSVHPAV